MEREILIEKKPNSQSLTFYIKGCNGQTISYIRCYPTTEDAVWHINEIYTDNEYRMKGYASEILKYVILYLKETICIKKITLTACPGENSKMTVEQLIDFYSKFGFVITSDTYNHMHLLFT